jgi:hypothetical protein
VIPGNNRVTLMWDAIAETSWDPITGNDFEGYRIYRSTDPGFNDMTAITDQFGSVAYLNPLVQFDLDDGIKGSATVPVRGIHFWLGDDTGLRHIWVDSTAQNGQKYYYAITSYDMGSDSLGIAPTECSKYISITPDGTVDKGKNVAIARPEAPSAGFVPSQLDSLRLLVRPEGFGTATGKIEFSVLNPDSLKDGHKYRVTFEDTLINKNISGVPRLTYTTKNFTLTDMTVNHTLIQQSTQLGYSFDQPIVDGIQLKFYGDSVLALDANRSGWNRQDIQDYIFVPYRVSKETTIPEAADYQIEFGEVGMDTSDTYVRSNKELPAIPVNFKVFKIYPSENGDVKVESKFAFREQDGADGQFSAFSDQRKITDEIIILSDDKIPGFQFSLDRTAFDSLKTLPGPGDWVMLQLQKPFMHQDVFEFVAKNARIDEGLAKSQMNRIKVVPNPYIVANSWEPQNPYSSGRGPRELHFTHLPPKCTIKIFNVRGHLVATIDHETPSIEDGTEIWDMLSNDKMDIAYGIYIYHIDAGKSGQKIGKFAVIK